MSTVGVLARPVWVLALSFAVICVLGCSFVFLYWMNFNLAEGVFRALIFVGVMGVVHLLGYRAWKEQPANQLKQIAVEVQRFESFWQAYKDLIKIAAIQQFVVLALTSMLLDGGRAFRWSLIAFIAAWTMNLMIMLRRPRSPTAIDILLVKYGFWAAVVVTRVLAAFMGRIA